MRRTGAWTWAEAFLGFALLSSLYVLSITALWAVAVVLGWY